MEWAENVFFTQDGANLEYSVSGSGEKLLFLPGCEQWEQEMNSLSEGLTSSYQLYRLNRRGWGNSAPRGAGYSLEQDCADVGAFLEAMGIRCIFAVGYGCRIALTLAVQGRCLRAVLFEPVLPEMSGDEWLPQMKREIERKDYTHAAVTYLKATRPQLRWMPRFALHLMFSKSYVTHDRDKQLINQVVVSDDPEADRRKKQDIIPDSWKRTMRMLEGIVAEAEAGWQAPLPELSQCDGAFLLYSTDESLKPVEFSIRKLLGTLSRARRQQLDFTDSQRAYDVFSETLAAFIREGQEDHV